MGKHVDGLFETFDDLVESLKGWTRAHKRAPESQARREARAAARQRKAIARWERRARARKKSMAHFFKTQIMGPKIRIGPNALAGIRAMHDPTAPRLADRILQAMEPDVYYSKRQIGVLIGKPAESVGATILRDLLAPKYVRKHCFKRPLRLEGSRQFSRVGFKITAKGMARAKEKAPVRAPTIREDLGDLF